MNNLRKSTLAGAVLALVLLAGCSTGGLGGVLGGQGSSSTLRGTVDYVNASGGYVDLINANTSNLSNGSGNTARVYFDNNTAVTYNNQQYRPTDLERGDQVTVDVDQSSGRLYARSMTVTYNANASGSSTYPGGSTNPGTYGSTVAGTVNYVDTSRQTIDIDPGTYNSRLVTVQYDANTVVTYNNQRYRPADLERGDRITVSVRDLGNGRLFADSINVTYNASSGGTSSGSTGGTTGQYSTVRGTVQYVDTNRRTIELNQTSWINGFAPNSGTTATGTILIQYDVNAQVNVQGSLQPVSGLERGDIVDVEVYPMSGGGYMANRVYLVRDVRSR